MKDSKNLWTLKIWKLLMGKFLALDDGWRLNGEVSLFHIRLATISDNSKKLTICLGKTLYVIGVCDKELLKDVSFFKFVRN
jgi:hypothetical protein